MKIDFVITWVDGSDPLWVKEFNKYSSLKKNVDKRACNYRDFNLLKYWFRGVDKFAPWVNKVYFITCGQKPDWLNVNYVKLVWIKHQDYIPQSVLPLFNSRAIEIGLHKIPELSEHFVYFNDDFYLINQIQPDFFFNKNLPRDMLVMTPLVGDLKSQICYAQLSNCAVINKNFNKYNCVKKNFSKFFNLKYGKENFRNLGMLPFPYISTFLNHHFAQPFLKSTFQEVWDTFPELCFSTQSSKFREPTNINQWLFRYWQLMEGKFIPTNLNKERKYYALGQSFDEMCSDILNQKYKEIVINDGGYEINEEELIKLNKTFEIILPEKSAFEL